jgi:hypothetical protein
LTSTRRRIDSATALEVEFAFMFSFPSEDRSMTTPPSNPTPAAAQRTGHPADHRELLAANPVSVPLNSPAVSGTDAAQAAV